MNNLKHRAHAFLELSVPGDRWGYAFDWFMVALISANVLAVILETVPALSEAYGTFFRYFDIVSVIIFTVEYVLRVWSCTADRARDYGHPIKGRIKFILSPLGIIDLLAILPFYLGFLIDADLRILRVFRLIRLLKLTRYSPALIVIGAVIKNQSKALTAALFLMLTALVLTSSIIFAAEHRVQPDKFGSIPDAMWWGIATLTTVGYGDVTPITPLGKFFGAVTMILGIGMFALPTGVIATGFANEIRKHEFIVSWRLVSRVPLFNDLDAAQIAEIVNLLNPLVVPPRHAVVRMGEPGDSMFFVISGELEVEAPGQPFKLGEGEFFGEMGLLRNTVRRADVVSLTDCQLLELTAENFWKLIDIHPDLGDRVREVMEQRLTMVDDATTRVVNGV